MLISQSLSNILIHVIFSTKNREPLIKAEIEADLHKYIAKICMENDCQLFQIGGVADHIHLLISLSRTITISKLISEIKANSSRWIKRNVPQYNNFSWQNGYGAFSVSYTHFDAVCNYIAGQKEHHQKISFKEEFITILNKYKIQWDEKYIWD